VDREAERTRREAAMRGEQPQIRGLDTAIARAALRDRPAYDALVQQRAALVGGWLKEQRLDPDYLRMPPDCPRCRDTGYAEGALCACVRNEVARRMFRDAGLADDGPSFEKFDLSLFSETQKIGNGLSVREYMRRLRDACTDYADRFPENIAVNRVFYGPSGVGKTYLMDCVARRVIARGFWVVRTTAFRVNEIMARAMFEKADPESLFDCDLLALDDLGVEPLLNKVTIASLTNLFNERSQQGKPFVISTNLRPEEILRRYGERLFSRMLDTRSTKIYEFEGSDLRRG
jgi:DNA replication protein DnaC